MLDSVEAAIEEIKKGRAIIVIDDENRENEGDLVAAAQNITYETLNFMAVEARGLTCVPVEPAIAERLGLFPMIEKNTDSHNTMFTVSVDAFEGTTTGISIADRLKTVQALVNPDSKPESFRRPGHMFPLIAKSKGVLERAGHTEAAVDLAKMAGFAGAGVICEILKADGTMARLDDLEVYAKKFGLKMISVEQLIQYRKQNEILVTKIAQANLPTRWGSFTLSGYHSIFDKKEHIVLAKGDLSGKENVLVRVHSECFTGDVLGSLRCDCEPQLHEAMQRVENEQLGAVIYMRQEGRGIGLFNKIKAYDLQDKGFDTVDANLELGFDAEMRDYCVAASIIKDLGIKSVRLLTNNPDKIDGLEKYNIKIASREPIVIETNCNNEFYMQTKKDRMGHLI
ncbi:MAG: bifunctional 3,4-dihydroxy-2-butanone-4-phosphate synthase/GTP cyclohydrolase II [Spirochaetales bacterium]|nr:bifunctional 3,4-dihydroxy-2-butanone-4-phosphate synthase/GTP cyclohydrolase II [Spirochaetales bacterium]